jgi:hypothetical protein
VHEFVLLHVEQRAFAALLRVHGDDVDRHDVAAQDLGVQALVGLQLDLAEQGVQVVAADVQQLAVLGQGGVEVAGGEAGPRPRREVAGPVRIDGDDRRAVRIGVSGQPVKGHAGDHKKQRVQAHGRQGEHPAGLGDLRPSQGADQGHGSAWRVEAAGQGHRHDRQADRQRGDERRAMEQLGAGNADQGRQDVAEHHRMRLSQGAGGHGEDQHGRSSDRRDQQRRGQWRAAGDRPGDQARGQQTHQGAQTAAA